MNSTNRRTPSRGFACAWLVAAFAGWVGLSNAHAQDADVPELKITIASSYMAEQSAGVALEHFASRISELSNGKMTAQIFHGGTLYSEDKSIQAVLDGTISMGLASASNHGPFTTAWRVIELPYLFESRAQFRDIIIHGEVGEALRSEVEKDGLKPLMVLETGGFRILGTNKAVKTPADLAEMKIRTPQSPVPLTFWQTAGANPTVVAWGETYLALGSGTVDGVDAAWVSWPLGQLWEVTKHITDVGYSSVASVVDVSTGWWENRTPAQQEIILQAAKEAEEVSIREEDASEAKIREQILSRGMTIHDLSPAEMEEWVKIGHATWDSIPDVSKEMLERIQKATGSAN